MLRATLSVVLTAGIALLVTACGPEPEYMEATVNGELWVAEGVSCLAREGKLSVVGFRRTTGEARRWIDLRDLPNAAGTVPLTADSYYADVPRGMIRDTEDALGGGNVYRGLSTTGMASVTELGVRGRCSGTFSFVAVSVHGDTTHVTDGWWTAELHVY